MLDRFLQGQISNREEKKILEWFRTPDAKETLFSFYQERLENASDQLDNDIQQRMFDNISHRIMVEKRKIFRRRLYVSLMTSAAILCLLFSIGYKYLSVDPVQDPFALVVSQLSTDFELPKDILLVLSEDSTVEVASEKEVTYNKDGAITIDNTEVGEVNESRKTEFNQLIVPKGKRTHLVLSDGTKVWVNAGSRIVYPRQFEAGKREIYVEGEVYLDVTPDPSAPFILKTASFEVKVLGTSFNVSSYSKEKSSSVVLVEGSVNIRNGQQQQTLIPNQRIAIADGNLEEATWVDVNKYICWIDNLLIFEDDPLSEVFSKLNLYYDEEFVIDPSAESLLVNGKLDLKENLEDVLKTISFSTPVVYEKESNKIIVKRVK